MVKDSFPRSKKFHGQSNFLLPILVFVLCVISFGQGWQINTWSLAFARSAMISGLENATAPEPPTAHRRAFLWLAQQALEQNDPERAMYWAGQAPDGVWAEALGLCGLAREQMGDFQGAVRDWVQARDWRNLRAAAFRAQIDGRLDDALYGYRALQAIDPEAAVLPFANFLQWPYNQLDSAIAALSRGLVLFPDSHLVPRWLVRRGDFYRYQRAIGQAISDYQQALALDATIYQAHLGLAWSYYLSGDDLNIVQNEIEMAIALAPDDALPYAEMARLFRKEKRWEEADFWYQQALARQPEWYGLWVERGNAAREGGDFQTAIDAFINVLAQNPNYDRAWYELAWTYRLNGNMAMAMETIERALVLTNSENASYLLIAGQIYEDAGQVIRAKKIYHQVLQMQPDNRTAQSALERLNASSNGK